jgi:hypothetical protein
MVHYKIVGETEDSRSNYLAIIDHFNGKFIYTHELDKDIF